MGNACRHFRQRDLILKEGGCAVGHPLRKLIKANTKEPMVKVFGRLCCKGNGTAIINCPSADFKSDAEIEAERDAMRAHMDRVATALPKLGAIKSDMIADNTEARVSDCPFCGAEGAMSIAVNITGNCHMHARCSACGDGIIE